MNWKIKTLTLSANTVRIAIEIRIFSLTAMSWNHRKVFQIERNNRDHMPGVRVVIQPLSKKHIKKVLLKNKHTDSIYLNLRKLILLDSQ